MVDTKFLESTDATNAVDMGTDYQRTRWNAGCSKFARWSPDKEYQLFFLDCPIEFRKEPLTKVGFLQDPTSDSQELQPALR